MTLLFKKRLVRIRLIPGEYIRYNYGYSWIASRLIIAQLSMETASPAAFEPIRRACGELVAQHLRLGQQMDFQHCSKFDDRSPEGNPVNAKAARSAGAPR